MDYAKERDYEKKIEMTKNPVYQFLFSCCNTYEFAI